MSVSTDDIAALVVVADREPPFASSLNKRFIDIRWVLDYDTDGTPRPSPILKRASPTAPSPTKPRSSADPEEPPISPRSALAAVLERALITAAPTLQAEASRRRTTASSPAATSDAGGLSHQASIVSPPSRDAGTEGDEGGVLHHEEDVDEEDEEEEGGDHPTTTEDEYTPSATPTPASRRRRTTASSAASQRRSTSQSHTRDESGTPEAVRRHTPSTPQSTQHLARAVVHSAAQQAAEATLETETTLPEPELFEELSVDQLMFLLAKHGIPAMRQEARLKGSSMDAIAELEPQMVREEEEEAGGQDPDATVASLTLGGATLSDTVISSLHPSPNRHNRKEPSFTRNLRVALARMVDRRHRLQQYRRLHAATVEQQLQQQHGTPARRSPSPSRRSAATGCRAVPLYGPTGPPECRTLPTLDPVLDADACATLGEPLIDSPRSALVILRSGLGVSDLIGVPSRRIRNEALLAGSTEAAVEMRLEADHRRRTLRREMLLSEYVELCETVPRSSLVEAMRSLFYARVRQDHRNVRAVHGMNSVVPVTQGDTRLLDRASVDLLTQRREQSASELAHILNLRERQRQLALAQEEALLQRQEAVSGHARHTNLQRDRLLRAKKEAAQQRQRDALARTEKRKEHEAAKQEQRREATLGRIQSLDERAETQRRLAAIATEARKQQRDRRRQAVRTQEHTRLENRREAVEAKNEFKDVLHQRIVEQREEQAKQRRSQLEEHEKRRIERRTELTKAEQARQAKLIEELQQDANRKEQEIAALKKQRQERKRERSKAREAKLRARLDAHAQAEKQRMLATDTAYQTKLEEMQKMAARRQETIAEQRERSTLVRREREEEQTRARSVAEYRSVAFVSANLHKSDWMERENVRRQRTALQLRQEREAILRSKSEMDHDFDGFERAERRRLELEYR